MKKLIYTLAFTLVIASLATAAQAGDSRENATTGGGYRGNWICLNNPNPKCS